MTLLSAQNSPGGRAPQLYVACVKPRSSTSLSVTETVVVPPLRTVQCALSWARAPKIAGLEIWAASDTPQRPRTAVQARVAIRAFMASSLDLGIVVDMGCTATASLQLDADEHLELIGVLADLEGSPQ